MKIYQSMKSDIPMDLLLGTPVIQLFGNHELNIENHYGIIEYEDSIIRIRTKTGQLKIFGKKLQIDYYTNTDMKIKGSIHRIDMM